MSFQPRWGRQVSKESRGHLQYCWGQFLMDLVPYLNQIWERKQTISQLQHVNLKHKTETDTLKDIPVWSGLLTGPFVQAALARLWQWCWYLLLSIHLSSCPEWQSQTRWCCWGSSPGGAWTWKSGRALRAAGCRSSSQIWESIIGVQWA